MKILTISIAAYNMEAYLKQCLDSLLDTRIIEDLEIIVVDDGSTDRTYEIAESYAIRYPESIFLVHKENGGYGTTVNYSIQHAGGKYFRLLDADDWLDKDGLYRLIKKLKETDVDVVVNPRYLAYESEPPKLSKPWEMFENKTIDIAKLDPHIFIPVHSIVYRTEALRKASLILPTHILYTDTIYTIEPFACMQNILFLGYPVYYYRLGREGQSVSRASMIKHTQDSLEVERRLCIFYEKCKADQNENIAYLLGAISIRYIGTIKKMLMAPVSINSLIHMKNFEKEMRDISKDVYKNAEKAGRFGLIIGIMRKTVYLPYWLFRFMPERILIRRN